MLDLKSPISQIVGGARGQLLETVLRVGRPFSIRQLAEMAGVHHSSAQEILTEFESMGIVSSQPIGRAIAYQAVDGNVLVVLLRRILTLRDEIVSTLTEQASNAPRGFALAVFGSVARGRATAGSDLDIIVVGDADTPEVEAWVQGFVRRATEISGMPVNALKYSREEWEEAKSRRDLIAEEILDGNIRLVGRL